MNELLPDSNEYQKIVHDKWRNFINHVEDDYSMIRPEVFESWQRSRDSVVNPHKPVSFFLSKEELNRNINASMSFISIIRPYMKRIYSIVEGTGAYILISDKNGYILDVIGDEDIMAEGSTHSKLVPGACRQEAIAGTNAIGTTLFLNRPTQLWGEEHYVEYHKAFSCAGAPFYDENDHLLGTFTVTCKIEYAHPHTLGMVTCAADSITREIKLNSTLEKLEMVNSQRNMIIENMTSGVILLSAEGIILQVNSVALNMLNLKYEQVIGKIIYDVLSIGNTYDPAATMSYFDSECYNMEVTISPNSPVGRPKHFNVSINHIASNSGNTTAILFRINRPEVIQKLVKRIEGHHAKYSFDDIIGESKVMQNVIKDSKKAAQTLSNVLVMGESGTGKELISQAIHNASDVSNGPFVAINCASIPNNLVESELFGYERGAFTGATKEGRPGKFELADGGTIFLDEIGDMPLDVQAKLLRVIQSREVTRVGGTSPRSINIRIIAATNHNLTDSIKEKTFREDLFYRLNVFTIYLPSLAERGPGDVKLLSDYFLNCYNVSKNTSYCFDPHAYEILQHFNWPGNVRQLENVIERAINLTDDNVIRAEHLPQYLLPADEKLPTEAPVNSENAVPSPFENISSISNIKDGEKAMIISALIASQGKITKAAETLGMNRRTLYRRLEKLKIDPSFYRSHHRM